MPKKIDIKVSESESKLQNLYSKSTSDIMRDKIKTLLLIKTERFSYQTELSIELKRTPKTIRTWLNKYEKGGIAELLDTNRGGNNAKIITNEINEYISKKVSDPHTHITSYVELLLLIENEFNIKIPYTTLYMHCRRRHKTKLKVSRKSHYKKDPTAEAVFKKP